MIRLSTPVDIRRNCLACSLKDRYMLLGSCFADEMGLRMSACGFDLCRNPFGTLYNPASLQAAVERLDTATPFTEKDCIRMGAGSEKICSFSHHTSFARADVDTFLENANGHLKEASGFWHSCNKVIITLGTAFVWEHNGFGIVGNCLKRDASEFRHYMLTVESCAEIIAKMVLSHPDKEFIFTVSPIRHMSGGAHENTLSKATLHLAVQKAFAYLDTQSAGNAYAYFPAWEILMDELRDYRFYADDLVHPSKIACDIVWNRFLDCFALREELPAMEKNEKAARLAGHIKMQ